MPFHTKTYSDWLLFYCKWWTLTGSTFYPEQQALIGEGADTGTDFGQAENKYTHIHKVCIANPFARTHRVKKKVLPT